MSIFKHTTPIWVGDMDGSKDVLVPIFRADFRGIKATRIRITVDTTLPIETDPNYWEITVEIAAPNDTSYRRLLAPMVTTDTVLRAGEWRTLNERGFTMKNSTLRVGFYPQGTPTVLSGISISLELEDENG